MLMLATIFAWIKANPVMCVLVAALVLNVLFAQLPKPTTERGLKIWNFFRTIGLVFSTHSTEPGTFTWPMVLKWILDAIVPIPEPKKPRISVPKVDPDQTIDPSPPTTPKD